MKSQKLKIENVKTSDLIPYIGNAKLHPEKQIGQIASSIKEFSFLSPVLLDEDNGIIAGHGRVLAAQKLKMDTLPCIRAKGLTPAQIRAYRIADNQLNLSSGWDYEILGLELDGLKELDFDLDVLGFDDLNFGPNEIDYEKEWEGMPEFENEDKTAFRSIVVHFKDQGSVDLFSGIVEDSITEETKSIWYPKTEIEKYMDKRYTDEP